MKTSTKLLIGLLIMVILFIISFLIMVRVYYEGSKIDKNLPNIETYKNFKDKEEELPPFNKLYLDFPGRIYYEQGTQNNIRIHAGAKVINDIKYSVINQELIIHKREKKGKKELIEIYISSDSLSSINITEGVRFESNSIEINSCRLQLNRSTLDAKIVAKGVDIYSSNKSMITIEGTTNNLNINSTGASIINLSDLIAVHTRVIGSERSEISVHVTGDLQIEISDRCIVQYSGNPVIKEQNIFSGAELQKVE